MAGRTLEDLGSDRLPLSALVACIMYSPPGSAVFHALHDGWTIDTHRITDLIQYVKMLIAANSGEPEKVYRELGVEQRPGQQKPDETLMTVGEYMKLAGMEG